MKEKNRELLSKDIINLLGGRPYLEIVLDRYLERLRTFMRAQEIDCTIRVDIDEDYSRPVPSWSPVVKIITEEEMSRDKRFGLASAIGEALDEELIKLRESNYKEEGITRWTEALNYILGTEEEIKEEIK